MKTLGKLESTEQTQGLFLRCLGGKMGFSRVDCICFGFSLISATDRPIFPWSPLTEVSSAGWEGWGARHERQVVALCPVAAAVAPVSPHHPSHPMSSSSPWCLEASVRLGSAHTMNARPECGHAFPSQPAGD